MSKELFGLCGACKYWEKHSKCGTIGLCNNAPTEHEALGFEHDHDLYNKLPGVDINEKFAGNMKFVTGYREWGELLTRPNFGCIEFEGKKGE